MKHNFISCRHLLLAAMLGFTGLLSTANPRVAQETIRQYLSGHDGENTVPWDFFQTVDRGTIANPQVAFGDSGQLDLPPGWKNADALAVTASNPNGRELVTWVCSWPSQKKIVTARAPVAPTMAGDKLRLKNGDTEAEPMTGTLPGIKLDRKTFSLTSAEISKEKWTMLDSGWRLNHHEDRQIACFPILEEDLAAPVHFISAETNQEVSPGLRAEQVRDVCIQGRRSICGKILQVLPEGVVVESGYTNLMREPLTSSWLLPGTVTASREANQMEGTNPGSICMGTVFLTDLPKSKKLKPKRFDYVIIEGYPAGQFTYNPVGTIHKTVRRFSAQLSQAVALTLQTKPPMPPP